jgi:hypothetical protein
MKSENDKSKFGKTKTSGTLISKWTVTQMDQRKGKRPKKDKRMHHHHHHRMPEIGAGTTRITFEDKTDVDGRMIAGIVTVDGVEVTLRMIMVDVDKKPIPTWTRNSRSRKINGLQLPLASNKILTWRDGHSIENYKPKSVKCVYWNMSRSARRKKRLKENVLGTKSGRSDVPKKKRSAGVQRSGNVVGDRHRPPPPHRRPHLSREVEATVVPTRLLIAPVLLRSHPAAIRRQAALVDVDVDSPRRNPAARARDP